MRHMHHGVATNPLAQTTHHIGHRNCRRLGALARLQRTAHQPQRGTPTANHRENPHDRQRHPRPPAPTPPGRHPSAYINERKLAAPTIHKHAPAECERSRQAIEGAGLDDPARGEGMAFTLRYAMGSISSRRPDATVDTWT